MWSRQTVNAVEVECSASLGWTSWGEKTDRSNGGHSKKYGMIAGKNVHLCLGLSMRSLDIRAGTPCPDSPEAKKNVAMLKEKTEVTQFSVQKYKKK